MSGGSFGYIQTKYGSDFITEYDLGDHVESMAEKLADYGTAGEKAKAATEHAHERIVALREQMAKMEKELDALTKPLRDVWRAVDYHSNGDFGQDAVLGVLEKYNKG